MSISVIIPVKNRAALLKVTLENILSQSLLPLEILVIDDHSTDNIAQVKEQYKDRVMFMNTSGSGPGAARNTGFLASTGKYIQFFDSDDLMTSDKLEIQHHQLATSSSGMAYCPHVKAIQLEDGTWKQSDAIMYYYPLPSSKRYDQLVLRGALMITQTCLFKREIIQEAGLWRTDLMTHEDLEFMFRIGKAEPYPVHSNVPAVVYRQHQHQITDLSTTSSARALDELRAQNMIYSMMQREGDYTFWDKKMIARSMIHAAQFVDRSKWPDNENVIDNTFNRFLFHCMKVTSKLQRIITRSEWRLINGSSNDPAHFVTYISKLNQ